MHYVEIMRSRRVLLWYTIILVGMTGIMAASVVGGHSTINDAGPIPLGEILLGCAVGAYVVATIVSTGLVSELGTLPITWTRPVARDRIAWSYVAVDLATILIAYVILVAVVLVCVALLGVIGYVFAGPHTWAGFVLGFGSAVMWYALTLTAASLVGGHGVRVAAFSWLAFLVMQSVWEAPVPAPIHAVLIALNYLNPIAYVNGVSFDMAAHSDRPHAIVASLGTRIALEWIISAVALVAAVRIWSTREA
ncbi:MAG TPA: hypothetical protein VK669_07800 [Candidatus Limnocylindrales bacterium]|nr:hypothetical protein [Candidatus Limnocylindrales bacterium]